MDCLDRKPHIRNNDYTFSKFSAKVRGQMAQNWVRGCGKYESTFGGDVIIRYSTFPYNFKNFKSVLRLDIEALDFQIRSINDWMLENQLQSVHGIGYDGLTYYVLFTSEPDLLLFKMRFG